MPSSETTPDTRAGDIHFHWHHSKRAKRMRMTVTEAGLEVTVPAGTRLSTAQKFVEANRDWAVRTLVKICGGVPAPTQAIFADLPLFAQSSRPARPQPVREISFAATGKATRVNYVKVPMLPGTVRVSTPATGAQGGVITVYCADPANPPAQAIAEELREWVREVAKDFLPDYINRLADKTGLRRPSQVRIGFQRTVWGSRAASGTISLSAHLMFLPPHILRHVALHELCHTVHMDHGRNFHRLLAHLDPNADAHAEELRGAVKRIPAWLRTH